MSILSEAFESSPTLKSLSTEQRVDLTNLIYDKLKENKVLTGEQLRSFRNDQMGLLYDADIKAGAVPQGFGQKAWKSFVLGADQTGMPGVDSYYEQQGGQRVQSTNKELFDQLRRKHFREDLEAHQKVLTDWRTYPKAAVKLGADLFTLGAGAVNALATGASNVMANVTGIPGAEGQSVVEAFSQGMEAAGKTRSIEEINKWYEDTIKDDPSLYKAYHAVATDMAIGLTFGWARMGKAAAKAAAAGNQLSGMTKARTLLAPAVSQPVGGQFIYHGLEALDECLKDVQLSDSQKNGIRVAALVAAAFGSGRYIEPLIEKAITGSPKIANAARVVGDTLADGKSFLKEVMENPYISSETKKLIEDIPGVQNLDDTVIAGKIDDIISAQAKVKTGEELTAEEAQALQSAKPSRAIEPLDDTEIVNFTSQPNAAPFEDLSSPYWKGEPVLERVRAANKPTQPGELDFFSGELGKDHTSPGVTSYRNKPPIPMLSPVEAAQLPTQGIMPLGKFATTQRGLASLDYLTQRLRILRNSGGSPEQILKVQQHLQNVHATLAIANDGLENIRKGTASELNKAVAELKVIEQEGKKAISNESRQTLRSQYLQKKARVDQLKDRLTVLAKVPVGPWARPRAGARALSEEDARLKQLAELEKGLTARKRAIDKVYQKYARISEATRVAYNRGAATIEQYDAVDREIFKICQDAHVIEEQLDNIRRERVRIRTFSEEYARLKQLSKSEKALTARRRAIDKAYQKHEQVYEATYIAYNRKAATREQLYKLHCERNKIGRAFYDIDKRLYNIREERKRIEKEMRARFAAARAAKAEKAAEAENIVSKAAVRAIRSDVETKIAELSEVQQARVRRVTEAVIQGKEYILVRQLTEEERLDELAKVFNSQSWVDRTYAPSNTKELSSGYLSAGWVEDNYPNAAKLFAVLDPQSVRTQVISPDVMLRAQQDLFARAGLGLSEEGYTLSRELIREVTELWDSMKGSIPKGEGAGLEEFLKSNAKVFGLTQKQAAGVAAHIADALPDLGIAFKFDAGLRSDVKELADSLTRVVTVGADQKGLEALAHGIGHLYFNYGLDSASKLAWLDDMRRVAQDESAWARNFPGYTERVSALAQLDEMEAMKQLFWAHNPVEMFSQQFASYTLNNVIPRMETLSTMGRLQAGLKKLLRVSYSDFDKLPEDTKKFFVRTLSQPDVATVRRATPQEIDDALSTCWVGGKDREFDLIRAEEIRRELDETYNGVSIGTYKDESLTAEWDDPYWRGGEESMEEESQILRSSSREASKEAAEKENIWNLPVHDRVQRYRPEDLNKALEYQALSLYHGLPGASVKEAEAISWRLEHLLSDKNLPDFIEYLARRGKAKNKYGAEHDPVSGITYSSVSERRAVERQWRIDDEISEFNQLDKDAQRYIERQNAKKWWAKLRQASNDLRSLLQQKGETMADKEIEAAARRALCGERPANAIEREFQGMLADRQEQMPPFDADRRAYSVAELHVAALSREYSDLKRFYTLALAKRGELDLIDPSVQQRLSSAEAFASLPPNGKRPWWSAGAVYKATMRGLAAATGGIEYDPDGVDLPFWGHVRWNPERAMTSPMLAFLFPSKTVWKVAKGPGSKLAGLAYRSSVPAPIRLKIDELTSRAKQMFKTAFTEGMGMPKELKDATSTARIFGQTRQQEALEFSEIMLHHFSDGERKSIARILEHEPGWQGLTKWATKHRPDVMNAVEIVRKVTAQIEKDFKDLGVESPRFADLRDTYLPRFYKNTRKRNLRRIFNTTDIKQLKIDLLNQRGIPTIVKNESAKGVPNMVFSELKDHIQQEGLQLEPGKTHINAYQSPGGLVKYAVEGSMLDKMFAGQMEPFHVWSKNSKGYILEDSTNSSYHLRRDYTKAERKMMGEVEDVSVRLAYMGEKLMRSYERAHLFHSVAQSKYVIDPSHRGDVEIPGMEGLFDNRVAVRHAIDNDSQWTLVPMEVDEATKIPKYGALSGTYVHRDVFDALKMIDRMAAARAAGKGDSPFDIFIKAHKTALLSWKLMKTAYSPVAHMNNFVSNIWMGYLHGDNPASVLRHGFSIIRLRNKDLRANKLVREGKIDEANRLRHEVSQSPYYNTYMAIRKSGMADSSMVASELKSDELARILTEELSEARGEHTGPLHAMIAIAKGFHRGATHLYEDGDLIFKMGGFHEGLMNGMTHSEALRKVYETYFDYSNLAPVAQALRDTGIMPFVSYSYKAIPALLKVITEHPERLAIASLALQGINDIGVATLLGPDEVIKNREALDAAKPRYLRQLSLGGLLNTRPVLPFGGGMVTTKDGQQELQASYLDLSRMVPGGDLWETDAGNVGNSEVAWTMPGRAVAEVLLQSPVFSAAANWAAGKNIALGRSYYEGGNLPEDEIQQRAAQAWLKDVMNSFTPNWPILPWTYSYDAMVAGLVGQGILEPGTLGTGNTSGYDSVGVPRSLTTAAWNTVGIKVRSALPEVTLGNEIISRVPWELRREKGALNKVLKGKQFSDKYRDERIESYIRTDTSVSEDITRKADLLQRLREAREARQAGQGGRALPR